MYQFVGQTLNKLYKDDCKKLRTNTILYGNMGEGRWHSHLQPPLSLEEIAVFEEEIGRQLPHSYKQFLTYHNGCYLFGLLRVAGKVDTYKGLSIEEQIRLPFQLENMQGVYQTKKIPLTYFIFADSIAKRTFYVIDLEENILELSYRTKKPENTYRNMEVFLLNILQEGKVDLEKGVFYEFE